MTQHDDLPLPDYDHLPVGSLTSRIRTLSAAQLATVLRYEREHADRVQVVAALTYRLEQLNSGDAEPSGGAPDAAQSEAAPAPAGGSAASTATSGPPVNPPSHGDPTNPAQPR
ncbi:hypothetical protein SAMN05661080_04096 [Modestobacter sp. DSM 44400]|uniref:hypothetical protein n=1 Tax=Modestobacter sp. DSM 44400 TaxID=1550230 RepID=UPI00089589C9|nr:hypothetical protein [Modestobacter sp. DSM 44400]SDY62953.1 hypothetical protein SAMN05661080_04096 [Modestobacter sp. DSM 44400]